MLKNIRSVVFVALASIAASLYSNSFAANGWYLEAGGGMLLFPNGREENTTYFGATSRATFMANLGYQTNRLSIGLEVGYAPIDATLRQTDGDNNDYKVEQLLGDGVQQFSGSIENKHLLFVGLGGKAYAIINERVKLGLLAKVGAQFDKIHLEGSTTYADGRPAVNVSEDFQGLCFRGELGLAAEVSLTQNLSLGVQAAGIVLPYPLAYGLASLKVSF